MPTPPDLLSDVWRETSRHIKIEESVAAIAGSMAGHLPLHTLSVLRVGAEQQSIEPLAVSAASGGPPLDVRAISPGGAARRRLGKWLRDGDLIGLGDAAAEGWLADMLPGLANADVLVGPLRSEAGPSGILLLVSMQGREFSAVDQRAVRNLLEPFAVALENDARLHELRSLREAAEADRERLLTRLGRQDVNEEVVGGRTGLRHVMDRVQLVAQSDVPVLILGETGTGKEVVSRAIHTRSPRAEGPFIRVNCGAIPPELVDSQLFGHEKEIGRAHV